LIKEFHLLKSIQVEVEFSILDEVASPF